MEQQHANIAVEPSEPHTITPDNAIKAIRLAVELLKGATSPIKLYRRVGGGIVLEWPSKR